MALLPRISLPKSLRRALRRGRWRVGRFWAAAPRARRAAPWAGALALNTVLAALIVTFSFERPPKGRPDAVAVVSVYVVPPPSAPPVIPEAQEPPEPPKPAEKDEEAGGEGVAAPAQAAADRIADAVPIVAQDVATTPTPPPATRRPVNVPTIALPQTQQGVGTPEGLVALNCYDHFEDADKAAECAGREILSGWQGEVAAIEGDWVEVARNMRRGGIARPVVGPDPLGGLGENTEIYQPADPRFVPREFVELGRYRESFRTKAEYDKFRALNDPKTYISMNNPAMADGGTAPSEPISGWRPSWMLRDDPNVDQAAINELLRSIEEAE